MSFWSTSLPSWTVILVYFLPKLSFRSTSLPEQRWAAEVLIHLEFCSLAVRRPRRRHDPDVTPIFTKNVINWKQRFRLLLFVVSVYTAFWTVSSAHLSHTKIVDGIQLVCPILSEKPYTIETQRRSRSVFGASSASHRFCLPSAFADERRWPQKQKESTAWTFMNWGTRLDRPVLIPCTSSRQSVKSSQC